MQADVITRGNELLRRLPRDGELIGVEVGVWDGRLSEYLLRSHPGIILVMVDRWAAVPADSRYAQSDCMRAASTQESMDLARHLATDRTKFANVRARPICGESVEVATTFPGDSFDFVFIDAEHTREAVTEDLIAWYPTLKPDGLIGGHDWEHPNPKWGVKQAVQDFIAERALSVEVETCGNMTWFFRKPEATE